MVGAKINDKNLVVDILTRSFIDNKSVNYIVRQDEKREQRIRGLMEYSFDVCNLFGDVLLSDDKRGCALILKPEQKKTTVKSIILDVKFVISVLSFSNLRKAMRREAIINKIHPKIPCYYLWFIGVDPTHQGHGTGSKLLSEIIENVRSEHRTICLETSTLKNIPWYEKHGFNIYHEIDFGYKLVCMKMP